MKIRKLALTDFRGYPKADIEFGDFTCLYGPNGIGKTTILDAISLLCSSLDFAEIEGPPVPPKPTSKLKSSMPAISSLTEGMNMTVTPQQRIRAYLNKNIRHYGQPGGATGFRLDATFEHDSKDYKVILTQNGFEANEVLGKPWWWSGISYFAKFDVDMVNFQLEKKLWPKFSAAYEGITGIHVEPDAGLASGSSIAAAFGYKPETNPLWSENQYENVYTGFFLFKNGGKVHSRFASAGEKKIAKSLTQVVNLPPEKMPHIVLVDNMEMHVHYKRHLIMFDEIKSLFNGMQIVSTTHSTMVIDKYEPQTELRDLEKTIIWS